jgi:hypothetical protein
VTLLPPEPREGTLAAAKLEELNRLVVARAGLGCIEGGNELQLRVLLADDLLQSLDHLQQLAQVG